MRLKINGQTKVIFVGLIAVVLTQYAWLLPVAHIFLVLSTIALVCAVIAAVWMLTERRTRR